MRLSEGASRWLFLAEVVVLALPSLAFMLTYAILFGGYSTVGAVAMTAQVVSGGISSPDGAWAALGMSGLMLAVAALCVVGVVAILKFVRVAFRFLKAGRIALPGEQGRFSRGLVFALPPLLVMLPFGWIAAGGEHAVDKVVSLYASGLVLAVPIAHLWLELRAARAEERGA